MIMLKRNPRQAQTMRLESLDQLLALTAAPSGGRACEDLIDAKGIALLVSLLRHQDHELQRAAARVLQQLAARGYHKHLLDHPALLPALEHLLRADSPEVNAAGAALVASIRPAPALLPLLPPLARILNFEADAARVDAARAIHGLITAPELFYDVRDYQDGKLMEQVPRRPCPLTCSRPGRRSGRYTARPRTSAQRSDRV